MTGKRVLVNTDKALSLTRDILSRVLNGQDRTECEVALLLAAAPVATRVRQPILRVQAIGGPR